MKFLLSYNYDDPHGNQCVKLVKNLMFDLSLHPNESFDVYFNLINLVLFISIKS